MKAIGHLRMKLTGIGIAIFVFSFLVSQIPASSLLYGQTVTFTGTQTTLPFSVYGEIAVDGAGDLFIASNGQVVEMLKTAAGYGRPTTLPASLSTDGVAVDSAGDVFVLGGGGVVELPRTATGYGPQAALPFSGLGQTIAIAVDSKGDVFVTNGPFVQGNGGVVELPKTAAGYGPQTTLISGLTTPRGVAVDSTGNVFVADSGDYRIVELPKTTTGYGPLTTLISGLNFADGVAVDSAGDVFVADGGPPSRALKLPRTATGYGPLTTLKATPYFAWSIAVDSAGDDVIIGDHGSAVFESDRIVELQTRSVNFGGVTVCATGEVTSEPCSQTLTLEYRATAGGTLGTPKVLTGGAPDLDFTLGSGSTCTGDVAEGAPCTVNVTFAPLTTGVRKGSVEITDGGGNVLTTTLISGVGEVETPLYFGTIRFRTTEVLLLTIQNVGVPGPVMIGTSINGPSYKILTTSQNTCLAGIRAGQSCTLPVEFDPVTVGKHNDHLTLTTSGVVPSRVNLQGTASGVGVEVEGPLDFGTISFGTTEILPLTITNVDVVGWGHPIKIETMINGPSYKILTTSQNTCLAGISSWQSCILPVEFDPVSVGNHNDYLILTPRGDAGQAPPSRVNLEGSAD